MKETSYLHFPFFDSKATSSIDSWQKSVVDRTPFVEKARKQSICPMLNQSQETFFSLIDDQLYTPVHAIMGFVQLIDINGQDQEEKAYCCEAIIQNSWLFFEMFEALLASLDGASLTVERAEALPFTVLVNHELRTPFNRIIGLSQLLKETDCLVACRDYCDEIQKNCLRLCSHLGSLLDFACLSRGTVDCSALPAPLESTVFEVIHQFCSQANAKQLDFKSSFVGVPLGAACLDNHLVKGALSRLLDDAIKFTSNGYVSLHIEKHYDFVEQQERLEFHIEDNGIGVEPNQLYQIFAPFQQSDSSTTCCFERLGLGLSIAQKQIETLGGTIVCSKNFEEGTTFLFSIPSSKVCQQKSEKRCA